MDFSKLLSGEIEKKKKIINSVSSSSTENNYHKTADLLDAEFKVVAEESQTKNESRIAKKLAKRKREDTEEEESSNASDSDEPTQNDTKKRKLESAQLALRELGEPVRIYGESDEDIINRSLQSTQTQEQEALKESLELADNDKVVKDVHEETQQEKPIGNQEITNVQGLNIESGNSAAEKPDKPASVAAKPDADFTINKDDVRDNLDKVSGQARDYIKYILSEWDLQAATKTDESEKKDELQLLVETKKWLLPLLVQLKKRALQPELLITLATVLINLQMQEWNHAGENYLKLSIGNVAWPIGVINVGIHSRSAHARLEGGDNVSNIMKDEKTRRWILALKRIITFCESHK